jgi:hypothetical protein
MKAKAHNRSLSLGGQDQLQSLGIIFLVLAVLLAVAIVYTLTNRVVGETTLFDTDEASHATPVLELYVAAQRRDIAHFVRAIFEQSFYPPVHSLTVLPSYLIAGPSLVTTRIPTIVTFAVLLIAVAILTYLTITRIAELGIGAALVATAAIVYFVSTSPVLIQNAVLSMLELIGCIWVMMLLWLCWRLDQSSSGHWARACTLALGLLVITLTKYTFGIFAIPAIVMAILSKSKSINIKKSQLIEGGAVLIVLAVGLGLWFIGAGPRGALMFALDQPHYAPFFSIENLFYYPRVWLTDFHLNPSFGLATALLACWGAIKGWNHFAVRTASWIIFFSLLILTISLNNQPRHFAFAALCVWFLAAHGIAQVLALSVTIDRVRTALSISLIVIFAFLGLSVFQRAGELQPMLTYAFEGQYGDRNEAMQSYILDHVDFEGNILILGLFDQLNHIAIHWKSAIVTGRAPSEISVDTWPRIDLMHDMMLSDDADEDDYEAMILRAAATQGYYSQIVIIHGKDSMDPYIVAAPNSLYDFKSTSRQFDDYKIDIFDIRDRR